ncbi:MAG: LacI family transcriptional regulator [Kosmotoga sp.]|nr:LacI family transcriptional regulator [Kosmotoga sp.]
MWKRFHTRGDGIVRTKLADVAKLAGVSIATASRVINNTGYVSSTVRERVLRAIDELGYQPTKAARFLAKKNQEFNVALVAGPWVFNSIKYQSDEFYTIIFKGMKDLAKNHGMNIELIKFEEIKEEYDSFLLVGGEITYEMVKEIKKFGKPSVLVDQYFPGLKIDCVVSDGFDGAVYAVNYLMSKGLKKIVSIHGPLSHFGFKNRFDGYVSAMESQGFLPKGYEFDEINDNMSSIIELMLRTYGKPEAIFGTNDTAALRAMEELQLRGFKIPEDVSIIGFDDIISASTCNPPLTTLKIFKYDLGSMAVRRLFNLLLGEEVHPVKISLFTQFIKRKSSL